MTDFPCTMTSSITLRTFQEILSVSMNSPPGIGVDAGPRRNVSMDLSYLYVALLNVFEMFSSRVVKLEGRVIVA